MSEHVLLNYAVRPRLDCTETEYTRISDTHILHAQDFTSGSSRQREEL